MAAAFTNLLLQDLPDLLQPVPDLPAQGVRNVGRKLLKLRLGKTTALRLSHWASGSIRTARNSILRAGLAFSGDSSGRCVLFLPFS